MLCPSKWTQTILASLLTIGSWLPPAIGRAQITGDVSLVESASAAYERNLANLRTWDAVAELTDRTQKENGEWTIGSKVTFAYDRSTANWISNWVCTAHKAGQDNKIRLAYVEGCEVGSAGIGDRNYDLRFNPPLDRLRSVKATRRDDKLRSTQQIIPEQLFWVRETPVSQRLALMKKHALEPTNEISQKLAISREGDLVHFRIVTKVGGRDSFDALTIDVTKGGLAVAAKYEDDNSMSNWQTKVENVSGVWVPVRWQHTRSRKLPKEFFERTLVWTENRVNSELSAQRISLETFRSGHDAQLTDQHTQQTSILPAIKPPDQR